jgi:hypothetical protein
MMTFRLEAMKLSYLPSGPMKDRRKRRPLAKADIGIFA